MDFTAVTSLLGSLKTASDIAKLINESDISLEKAEAKLKLAELVSALAVAKLEAAGIDQILFEKQSLIQRLEQQASIREQLVWQEPSYWKKNGKELEGPFCQHCYDTKHDLVRLQCKGEGYWECYACKNNFLNKEYRDRQAASIEAFKSRPRQGY
jgi:hypothetical protein